MGSLESDTLDRLDVVTARKDASNQQHVKGEVAKIDLLDASELIEIYLKSLPTLVKLEEALLDAEGQQIGVLSEDNVDLARLPHVGQLGVSLVRYYNVLHPHLLGHLH